MMKDVDKVLKHVDKIVSVDVKKATSQAISLVQRDAKFNVRADTGELRASIYTDIRDEGDRLIGTCYTNNAYAAFVEFGTGPRGQRKHDGISPDVNVVYSQSPWWIHESQVNKATAEKYHWFYVDTENGRFYQCSGQPARPYLYPALKDNEKNIMKLYDNEVRKAMK